MTKTQSEKWRAAGGAFLSTVAVGITLVTVLNEQPGMTRWGLMVAGASMWTLFVAGICAIVFDGDHKP